MTVIDGFYLSGFKQLRSHASSYPLTTRTVTPHGNPNCRHPKLTPPLPPPGSVTIPTAHRAAPQGSLAVLQQGQELSLSASSFCSQTLSCLEPVLTQPPPFLWCPVTHLSSFMSQPCYSLLNKPPLPFIPPLLPLKRSQLCVWSIPCLPHL